MHTPDFSKTLFFIAEFSKMQSRAIMMMWKICSLDLQCSTSPSLLEREKEGEAGANAE